MRASTDDGQAGSHPSGQGSLVPTRQRALPPPRLLLPATRLMPGASWVLPTKRAGFQIGCSATEESG